MHCFPLKYSSGISLVSKQHLLSSSYGISHTNTSQYCLLSRQVKYLMFPGFPASKVQNEQGAQKSMAANHSQKCQETFHTQKDYHQNYMPLCALIKTNKRLVSPAVHKSQNETHDVISHTSVGSKFYHIIQKKFLLSF